MNYQISSTGFDDPDIPALLKILANYFQSQGIEFYVVGAAARDIVLGMIHNLKTRRKTNDLDIAIMIRDWETFEKVNSGLCSLSEFTKSFRQKQRFHYKNSLITGHHSFWGDSSLGQKYILAAGRNPCYVCFRICRNGKKGSDSNH